MDATLIKVAEAVLLELQSGSFSLPFSVDRAYLPRHTPQQLKNLLVTVVPAGWTSDLASRHTIRRDCTIQVGLQQKLLAEGNAELDPLVSLAQELESHFRQLKRLPTVDAVLVNVEALAAPCDDDDLDQRRVFTAVLAMTFRVLE
jgi:hypothetical protein